MKIDLDKAEWNIPAERMKMRELHALTGGGRYVFPGVRTNGRPMSDNVVLAALRRMGFVKDKMSGHGFRAMARIQPHRASRRTPENDAAIV